MITGKPFLGALPFGSLLGGSPHGTTGVADSCTPSRVSKNNPVKQAGR